MEFKETIKKYQKWIAGIVTIALLFFIFRSINFGEFTHYLVNINLLWFGVFLFLMIPLVLVVTMRLKLLASKEVNIGFFQALKLSMSAGSLNLITPSKGGDIIKAIFFKKLKLMNLTEAVGLVIFEKTMDLFALCVFSVAGLLVVGHVTGFELPIMAFSFIVIGACAFSFFIDVRFLFRGMGRIKTLLRNMYTFFLRIKKDEILVGKILALSFLSWTIQLAQFWFLFMAFDKLISPLLIFALVPAALLFSMIPIFVSGWSGRELALITLFLPFAPSSLILGVSIISSLRYYIPGLVALPFVYDLSKK